MTEPAWKHLYGPVPSRRPPTLQDIALGLSMHPNEAVKYVVALRDSQQITTVERNGQEFYVPAD